ncbi:hypothetical protein BGX29_007856 [Mortierella sp. GBA35]|nr:hypothetical protein BGX29_007856 [Mortierella sp. GBA35]
MSDIMFLCLHNADLSQVAAAFFNKHKTRMDIRGRSAGIYPAVEIPALVREIMSEIGIDLSGITPVQISSAELKTNIRMLVTMEYDCILGFFPKDVNTMPWIFEDPKDFSIEEARIVRDEIERKVKDLIVANNY